MHTYTPVVGVVNLILNNPYLSVNVVLLLSFVLSGFGTFLLASRFLNNKVLAFLCGFVFAFSPYKMSHLLEHHHLMLTATVPFYIMCFTDIFGHAKGLKMINYRKVLACLALGILTFLSDYYTTFFLLAFSLLFLFYFATLPILSKLNLKLVFALFSMITIGIHLLVERLRILHIEDKGGINNSGDLLGLLIPWERSRFFSLDFFKNFQDSAGIVGPNEHVVFIGYSLILLTLVAIVLGRKVIGQLPFAGFLGFCCVVFFFLAFPKLKFNNHALLYSPTSFIHFIPGINNIRNPTRFVAMLYLFWPLLSFICIEKFLEGGQFLKWLKYGSLGLAVIVIAEYYPVNYPLIRKSDVPDFVFRLEKDSEIRQILNVPSGAVDGFKHAGIFKSGNLQWAIHHKKNLMDGYISRLPDPYFELFEENPVLRGLNLVYQYGADSALVLDKKVIDVFWIKYKPQVVLLHVGSNDPTATEKYIQNSFADYIFRIEKESGYTLYYLRDKN
jgi:hypothetical protein